VSALLDEIRSAAAPYGLNLVAAIPVERYDAAVTKQIRATELAPGARSIVVIGNGGGALWAALKRHAAAHPGWIYREHPLDDYTRTIVESSIAVPLREASHRCTVVYPFVHNQRTLNFMELGKIAGLGGPSIIGVAVHPEFGQWIAFRAALLIDELIDEPGPAVGFDPCPSCVPRSCIAACPVNAVSIATGWDVTKCLTHRVEVEEDCGIRCHARVACVLAPQHVYSDEELAHHQSCALRAMKPWYDANIRK
jgi:epoxyqueuosine reductase QueG